MDRNIDGQKNRQTVTQIDSNTDRQKHRSTDILMDKNKDKIFSWLASLPSPKLPMTEE